MIGNNFTGFTARMCINGSLARSAIGNASRAKYYLMIIAKCVYYRTDQPRGKCFDQYGLANYRPQWRGIPWLLVTRDPVRYFAPVRASK